MFVLVSKKYHLFWLLDQTQIQPVGKSTAGLTSGDSKSRGRAAICCCDSVVASVTVLVDFCNGGDADGADDSGSLAGSCDGFDAPVVVC